MWPVRVSNPGPLALESEALPNALHVPNAISGSASFRQSSVLFELSIII